MIRDTPPSLPEPVFEERTARRSARTDVSNGALANGSSLSEEFRVLRAKVRALGEQRPLSCVGIVSGTGGEGKTTIALGLSAALAREQGARVLLVEADLRRPAIERYTGLEACEGVGEWLLGNKGPVPLRVLPDGLRLLTAGKAKIDQAELLGSPRMAGLLQAARARFDFIVVDCPPLVPVADSVILQDLIDGFLLVVRARHSPRETLQKAVSNLKPDRIHGVVFNDHREVLTRYYSYGYSQYRS